MVIILFVLIILFEMYVIYMNSVSKRRIEALKRSYELDIRALECIKKGDIDGAIKCYAKSRELLNGK